MTVLPPATKHSPGLVSESLADRLPLATAAATNSGNGWLPISQADLVGWNSKLLSTDAHYRQYPFWCGPYQRTGFFTPRYYSYRTRAGAAAYVCILERKVCGIKLGLVNRGPVVLGGDLLSDEALRDLLSLGKTNGYAFMRFTHSDKSATERLLQCKGARQQESFPFYRDPPKSLIVTQLEQDTAMLATFQPVARREIGYAEKAGFCIHPSDSLEAYRKVWPMFGQLADRKGFHLTDRRLDDWLDVIEAARKHGCSQLYTASLGGVCVSAIHLLRYGQTVEFMLGALDVRLLGDNPSPSALLHWRAMRDFHRDGCRFYNLGGPGDGVHNKVYPFKRKFRPELRVAEPPVTIVLNPGAYRCWDLFVLKGWLGSKRIAKAGFHKGKRAVNQLFSKPRAGQAPDEQGETPRSPNS